LRRVIGMIRRVTSIGVICLALTACDNYLEDGSCEVDGVKGYLEVTSAGGGKDQSFVYLVSATCNKVFAGYKRLVFKTKEEYRIGDKVDFVSAKGDEQ